ncbi:hypothetical protein [Agrobacterium vitis]|uniref:hypothetical protein n=1 Tax=Agrobacterium vitis TaxID=373 RepID=UPI0018D25F86|nr:hypothetical protein [Agrobacterium vitis]
MRSNVSSSRTASAMLAATSEATNTIATAVPEPIAVHHNKTRLVPAQLKSWPSHLLTKLMSLLLIASLVTTSFAATANARFISPDD